MSAMLAAIKAKKSKPAPMDEMAESAPAPSDGGVDLHSIVSQLSEDQKHELYELLCQDMGDSSDIQKGEASTEEKGKIAQAIDEQDQEGAPADIDDSVNAAMLDRRDMAPDQPKPRNLGERIRQTLASKLNAKGKA